MADLDEAIRIDPNLSQPHVDRGAVWASKNEPDRAMADLNEAIRIEPRNPMAYLDRGLVWMMKKQPDKAMADMDEAIRIAPDEAFAYRNRAGVWLEKKEYARAIADMDEAIRRQPENAGLHTARASLRGQAGRYEEALADLAEATRLEPDNSEALNNRAWILATCPEAKFRDGGRAVASATRACELTGWEEANVLDTLAAACAEAGDFEGAVRWQTKANAGFTDEAEKPRGEARLKLYQEHKPYRDTTP